MLQNLHLKCIKTGFYMWCIRLTPLILLNGVSGGMKQNVFDYLNVFVDRSKKVFNILNICTNF